MVLIWKRKLSFMNEEEEKDDDDLDVSKKKDNKDSTLVPKLGHFNLERIIFFALIILSIFISNPGNENYPFKPYAQYLYDSSTLISPILILGIILLFPWYSIFYFLREVRIPIHFNIKTLSNIILAIVGGGTALFFIFIFEYLIENYPSFGHIMTFFILSIAGIGLIIILITLFWEFKDSYYDYYLLKKHQFNSSESISRREISNFLSSLKTDWGRKKYIEKIRNEGANVIGEWDKGSLSNFGIEVRTMIAKVDEKMRGFDR